MSKRNIKKLAPHIGRRLYVKVLEGLQEKRIIRSFEEIKSLLPSMYRFNVWINDEIWFDLEFLHLPLPHKQDQVVLACENFNKVAAGVGHSAHGKTIRLFINEQIRKRFFGLKVENEFQEFVELMIKRNGNFVSIIKAKTKEDKEGIDFYLGYKDTIVPIQIKTGTNGQKKHQEKFPTIPSLYFSVTLRNNVEIALFTLEKICASYTKGTIEHF